MLDTQRNKRRDGESDRELCTQPNETELLVSRENCGTCNSHCTKKEDLPKQRSTYFAEPIANCHTYLRLVTGTYFRKPTPPFADTISVRKDVLTLSRRAVTYHILEQNRVRPLPGTLKVVSYILTVNILAVFSPRHLERKRLERFRLVGIWVQ